MNVIAEKKTDKDLENFYELFEAKDMLTVSDETVSVKVSLGFYTLEQLEVKKSQCEAELTDINTMIESINNLKITEK